MEIRVFIKSQKEPVIYIGDRIDVLDFEMQGSKYKQIRCFENGISKSELIEEDIITSIKNVES